MSQPDTAPAPDAWDPERVRKLIREAAHLPGALLPALHAIHDAVGYIPPGAVPIVAEELNLARAEVHGVISFYHFFRQEPPGRRTVRLCRAEACQSMNGDALAEHASKRLGTEFHGTSADGRYSLEPVYCLGNCALAPAAMIDGRVYGRVDAARLDELLGDAEE